MCAPFDPLPYRGIFGRFSLGFGPLCLAQNLCLKLGLMFEVHDILLLLCNDSLRALVL